MDFKIKKSRARKFFWYTILIVILGILGFYAYRIFFLKDFAAQSKAQIYAQLEEARAALANLDPESARDSFSAIDEELMNVQTEANKYGVLSLSGLVDKFKNIPDMLRSLSGISGTAVHISEDISFMKENAATLMLTGQGQEFIERLKVFNEKLTLLTEYIESLDRNSGSLDNSTQKKLAQLRAEIDSSQKALGALISFINSDKPQNLLILFQNPTEQRPAGGFIGSYAIITIDKGSIGDISVRDIYDPDGQLDLKVIPPQPLQAITTKWGARDANWFFDFPTSAQKVIYFLNNSKIYSEKNMTFAGAIAVNTKVLQDIVGLIGPIDLPEYKTIISKDNFLSFIQKEVESGEDKKVNQPKKILQVLTPKLMEKLTNLPESGKQALVKLLEYHANKKNIMAYLSDHDLELYVKTAGIAGEVYKPSNRTVSEYLAVVNTNIAGGKSDAFIDQKIDFKSMVDETGEITNNLTVTRKNTAVNQKEWWYNATNKDYMQIYTTVGSRAEVSTGRDKWPKTISPKYNDTYLEDADVENIESTEYYLRELGLDRFIAFDKTVFAAWFNTTVGKEKTFTLTYKNPRKLNPDSQTPYEFIFENQSGASTTLAISIDAPPQYKWKELNSANIRYQSDDPPGRVIIRNTLIPIR